MLMCDCDLSKRFDGILKIDIDHLVSLSITENKLPIRVDKTDFYDALLAA
jgi:hypothetical protein